MTAETRRRCRVDGVVLAVLIIAAAALRFHGLDAVAFVTDEVHSIHMATGSEEHDMVAAGWTYSVTVIPKLLATQDIHPPFYFILLDLWLKLFGTEVGPARAFSIPFMLACIPLTYLIGLRLRDRPTALIAAGILALSPFQIRYTQDLRMYGLMEFLLLLATYLFLCLLDRPRWRLVVAYGVTVALALLTHYFSIYLVLVHGLYYLIRRKNFQLSFKRFALAMVLGAALFMVWVGFAGMERMERTYDDTGWLKQAKTVAYFGPQLAGLTLMHVTNFVFGTGKAWVGWGWDRITLAATMLPLLLLGMIALARKRDGSLLIVLWILVPFVGMMAVDLITGRHAFHLSRYLIGCAAPCYLLFAAGVSFFQHRLANTVLLAMLIVALGVGHWRHEDAMAARASYDEVAKAIETAPQKAVLFPVMASAIQYYVCDPSMDLQPAYGMFSWWRGDLDRFLAHHDEFLVVVPFDPPGGGKQDIDRMVSLVKTNGFRRVPDGGPKMALRSVRIDLYRRGFRVMDGD